MRNKPDFVSVGGPYWDDRPLAIVATGPSLTGFDFNRLQGPWRVLAVKQSYRDMPFADAVFGLDVKWHEWDRQNLEELAKTKEVYVAYPPEGWDDFVPIPGVRYVKRDRQAQKFSEDPSWIESGANSGFGATNLAFLKRPRFVALFGFDYKGEHYNPAHYTPRPLNVAGRYLVRWAEVYETTIHQWRKIGCTVVNASPNSNIKAFPKLSHDEALAWLRLKGGR